jgi:1,4-dihydroxy-2-naphthoate octaprenyltransferase
MGKSLSIAAHQRSGYSLGAGRRLLLVLRLVRYRFFLFAGLLPYLLGAAWAFGISNRFDSRVFWCGLGGVALAVVGVEAFNDFFDSRMGTDRVFDPEDHAPVSDAVLWLGVAAFAGALAVGAYLTLRGGWPVLLFAALGGAAAIFYEAPPIRWSYRGLGEAVIALSYGPAMVLGSLYLQTRSVSFGALWASLVPGFLVMALAVVNAIPDFHQDRLVGKRNLVVRFGRRRAVWLYVGLASAGLLSAATGAAWGEFPMPCLAALLALPLLVVSARRAIVSYDSAARFVPAIGSILACYVIGVSLFTAGILLNAWR